MAEVHLYCGPQRSGRVRALDDLMRAHWDRALFLVPTRQLADDRLERIILESDLKGAWGARVLTFEDFVRDLLEAERADVTPIDEFERALLLQDAIGRVKAAGGLEALGSAADTAGFHGHMQRLIGQLKQAAVEPEEFRERTARRPRRTVLDEVVADVYAAYQALLIEYGLYDRQGLYWEAGERARNGRPKVLRDVLLLDGFDDFTPSEFRLLERLEPYLELLVFGLNYDIGPDRRDLYRVTAATADKIRERFSPVFQSFSAAPPDSYSKFASAHLFWRDPPGVPPETLRADLEVQPCPGAIAELEHVGRRIKGLLRDGVPAEEIAVIYRDLEGVSGLVRSVFGEFGIPVRVVRRPSLAESAVCAFLLDFYDAAESWEREAVVEVLTSPWFRPPDRPQALHTSAYASLSRLAQIVAGHREWDHRLASLVRRFQELETSEELDEDDPADPDLLRRYRRHMPDAPAAAQELFDRFLVMTEIAMDLPPLAGMCRHVEAFERLIEACGLPYAAAAHPVAELRRTEGNALTQLRSRLAQIYAWCEDDEDDALVERGEFVLRLGRALRDTFYDPEDPPVGVACLDAEAVRGLRFDHVFLCGANEGVFPRPGGAGAVYTDDDLDELERVGIPLDGRRGRADREALLFHRILDVPRRHLVITARTLTSEGREARLSPYVEDLLELFPGKTDLLKRAISPSDFVPAVEDVASWRDVRNVAFSKARGLQRTFADEFAATIRGARIEARRYGSELPDAYDGNLADERLRERLARTFGPSHVFSVSQLEMYITCPFRYFAERVLGILDIEPPSEEFAGSIVGIVLHDVLQAFHSYYRGRALAEVPEDEARLALNTLTDEVFTRMVRGSQAVPAGIAAVERRRVEGVLERYLRQSRNEDELRWKPQHFEVTFGERRRDFEADLDRPEAIPLETSIGVVLFKGRIDRIDRDGDCVRVLDYKSGEPPSKSSIKEGLSLQLPLYALAVEEHLMADSTCAGAFFLQLGRDKWVEGTGRSKTKDEWSTQRETTLRAVVEAVQGIREGRFPPAPRQSNACAYCAYARACRYEESRIKRKLPEGNDAVDA